MHPIVANHDFRVRPRIGLIMAAIWFFYLILKPFYFFPKGLPQISDVFLLGALIPAIPFMFMKVNSKISVVMLAGGLFVVLCAAVNMINYFFYPDFKFVLSGFYYIYNFLIFSFVVFLFRKDYSLMTRICTGGIFFSLLIQVILLNLLPEDTSRLTGGFKNPNQLSYWALLSAAMLIFLRRGRNFILADYASLGMAGYLQAMALSKAGIIAFSVMMFVTIFMPQVGRSAKLVILLFLSIGASFFFFAHEKTDFKNIERVESRLKSIGEERDDSLYGRGYTRIAENPEYMLLGAGEGAYERFQSWGAPKELHSGLATILFSYGIIGLGLFGLFLYLIFYRQPWHAFVVLFAVLLMSITSQTIRFTHSWVFFGIAYGSFMFKKDRETGEEDEVPAILIPQAG